MGSQVPSSKAKEDGPASTEVGVRLNCAYCTLTWTKPYELARHLGTHTNAKPFQCPTPGCFKSFSQKTALQTHSNTHTRQRPHFCRKGCTSQFGDPSSRTRHEKEIHMPEIGFRCPICIQKHKRKEAFRKHYFGVHSIEPTTEIFEAAKKLCREMWEQEEAENGRPPVVAVQSKKRPSSAIIAENVAPPARKRRGAIASASTSRPRVQPSVHKPAPQFPNPQLGHRRNGSEESSESFVSSAYSNGAQGAYAEAFNPAYPLPMPYHGVSSEAIHYSGRDSSSPGGSPGGYQSMRMPSPQFEYDRDDVTEMALRRLAGAHIPTVQAAVAPAETVTGPSGGYYGHSSGVLAPDMSRSDNISPPVNRLDSGRPVWMHAKPSNYPNTSGWSGTHAPAESVPRSMPHPVHHHSLGYGQLQVGQVMPEYYPYGDQNGDYRTTQAQGGHLPVASGSRGESHIGFIDNTYRQSHEDDGESELATPPHPESVYNSPSFYDGPTPVMPVTLTGVNGVVHD